MKVANLVNIIQIKNQNNFDLSTILTKFVTRFVTTFITQ
jgi:hypothetical protein